MKIPFVDLTRSPIILRKRIQKDIDSIIASGEFILGRRGELFERKFASYLDIPYCVGVASGTDALVLSLRALGIQPGDEVIVPAMTFIASVSPLLMIGAKPVLVDIDIQYPVINPERIEEKITKKTKAIIGVHLHGYLCAVSRIQEICKKNNLFFIEDACQAHGSENNGKAGTFGDIGFFSFYPGKNLGAFGDAGAIVTSSFHIFNQVMQLRNHGEIKKYMHSQLGYNSRLDEIQASVLNYKLPYLDKWNRRRRKMVGYYMNYLKDLPVTFSPFSQDSNYHIFSINTSKRDQLQKYLASFGIDTRIHYPIPIHKQPVMKPYIRENESFPYAQQFADSTLSLPLHPFMSQKEIMQVSYRISDFFSRNK